MATELTKPVARRTSARVFETGQRRHVVLTLLPPARVGVRLAGTRLTYQLDAEMIYSFAVKRFVADIETRAKAIRKREGVTMRSARARARKELIESLKV